MREILYRGLHRRKGEKVRLDGTPVESKWVYGGYCQYNEERGIIYQTEPDFHKYPVYADTVGQYTGLTDKNGVKIFEGDVVRECYKNCDIEEFRYNIGKVFYCEKNARFLLTSQRFPDCYAHMSIYREYEVIGNIHDNPELLGGKENELDRR